MKYKLYHIPGKKIGVTLDPKHRVETQQGYGPGEYEILEQSDDIDYISKREIELQKSHGYRVDETLYKQLNPNKDHMRINITEQTTTFPVPLNKLKGRLMDNIGKTWETIYGQFKLDNETIKWITDHAKTSMYDAKRTYVYNKAFFEAFYNENKKFVEKESKHFRDHMEAMKANLLSHSRAQSNGMNDTYQDQDARERLDRDRFQLIRDWATERGLYDKGDTKTQYCKLMEEAGELGRAILKDNHLELVDAVGDMVVVLTNLACLAGTNIEHCIDSAYDEIKNRKGKMKNGTFVKA